MINGGFTCPECAVIQRNPRQYTAHGLAAHRAVVHYVHSTLVNMTFCLPRNIAIMLDQMAPRGKRSAFIARLIREEAERRS